MNARSGGAKADYMSDASASPGWWLASDLKWYPPELHPDYVSPGTDWWLASDLKWYPPELHPDASATTTGYAQPASIPAKQFAINKPVFLVVATVVVLVVIGGVRHIAPTASSSNSVQSTASGVVADLQSGNIAEICTLASTTEQPRCNSALDSPSTISITYKNLVVSTVKVNGDRALVVTTGRMCLGTGQCVSNSDFNAVMGSERTFNEKYANALGSSVSNPFIIPLVREDGKWYVTGI